MLEHQQSIEAVNTLAGYSQENHANVHLEANSEQVFALEGFADKVAVLKSQPWTPVVRFLAQS